MPTLPSTHQTLLATAIILSNVGTFLAITDPDRNPNTNTTTQPDIIHSLHLTSRHNPKIALLPLLLLSLYTTLLTLTYPHIPLFLLRHGARNGLNTDLITWSPATLIPLTLIFLVGIPLRLIPYASLGSNFTFALKEPDRLVTTGIYAYLQHPSYTGLVALVVSNGVLLGRTDGVPTCWFPPGGYRYVRRLVWVLAPVALALFLGVMGVRVREEERMMWKEFGAEWEVWHGRTARFVPWLV